MPEADEDLDGISTYIFDQCGSAETVRRFVGRILRAIDGLSIFPSIHPRYIPDRPLVHEYRKLIFQRYVILFCVDDDERTVSIMRIFHSARNISSLLDGEDYDDTQLLSF